MIEWQAPILGVNRIKDDIEDYSSWIVDGIGYWRLVDGDRKRSYGLTGHDFEHSGQQYAFIVFNPQDLGADVNTSEAANFKAYSGEQYLACFSAVGGKNDDWLISLELSGDEQTIEFYVKNIATGAGSYVEEFEVAVSETGRQLGNFKIITPTPIKVTNEWMAYSFNLSVGTKNFVIHVVSDDQFALFVDDICY